MIYFCSIFLLSHFTSIMLEHCTTVVFQVILELVCLLGNSSEDIITSIAQIADLGPIYDCSRATLKGSFCCMKI